VPQVDPALVVLGVRGHVLETDLVVRTVARATHRGDDVVSGPEKRDVWTDGLYPSEHFVTDHEEVVTVRGMTVLRGVDLAIGAVHTDPKDPHQDAAPIGHVRQ
jgi:hypothetical protein